MLLIMRDPIFFLPVGHPAGLNGFVGCIDLTYLRDSLTNIRIRVFISQSRPFVLSSPQVVGARPQASIKYDSFSKCRLYTSTTTQPQLIFTENYALTVFDIMIDHTDVNPLTASLDVTIQMAGNLGPPSVSVQRNPWYAKLTGTQQFRELSKSKSLVF